MNTGGEEMIFPIQFSRHFPSLSLPRKKRAFLFLRFWPIRVFHPQEWFSLPSCSDMGFFPRQSFRDIAYSKKGLPTK